MNQTNEMFPLDYYLAGLSIVEDTIKSQHSKLLKNLEAITPDIVAVMMSGHKFNLPVRVRENSLEIHTDTNQDIAKRQPTVRTDIMYSALPEYVNMIYPEEVQDDAKELAKELTRIQKMISLLRKHMCYRRIPFYPSDIPEKHNPRDLLQLAYENLMIMCKDEQDEIHMVEVMVEMAKEELASKDAS